MYERETRGTNGTGPGRRWPQAAAALVLFGVLAPACTGGRSPDEPVSFPPAEARKVRVQGYRYDPEFRRVYVDVTNGSRLRVNKMVVTFRSGDDELRCNAYGDVAPGETGVLAMLRAPNVVKSHRPAIEQIAYYPRLAQPGR